MKQLIKNLESITRTLVKNSKKMGGGICVIILSIVGVGSVWGQGIDCQNPIVITSLPFNDAGNTSTYGNIYSSTNVPAVAPGAITNGSNSSYLGGDEVVYAYTPVNNEVITISVTGVGTWTGLFAFTGCPFGSTVGSHTNSSAGNRLIPDMPVVGGITYYFVISTWPSPQNTDYTIEITLGYCTPEGTNSSRYINNFSTTDGTQNITNNGSGFSIGGYGDFTNMTVSQEVMGTVNFNVDIVGGTAGFRIWVDWNQDGVFDEVNEVVYNSSAYSNSHNGSFEVPANALLGSTRMRIVSHWLSTTGNIDPCITGFTYGEFEDYEFIVTEPFIIEPEESCDMIYVDGTNGSDSNQGTAANPVKTLSRAMLSVSPSRNYIKMTTGTYAENTIINLQDDLVIDGRYTNNNGVWSKSSNAAAATSITLSGEENINNDVAHVMGFKSDGKSNWKLIDLNITTANASGHTTSRNGKSNYALYIANNSANYEITRCVITAGNASGGQGRNTDDTLFDGKNGANGAIGTTGSAGESSCALSTDYGGAGGNGGIGGNGGANSTLIGGNAPNGSTGGKGGRGKDDNNSNGTAGSGMTGTCSGGGGTIGLNDSNGNDSPYGGSGTSCNNNGANGTSGTTTSSSYLTGYFIPGYGSNGTAGSGGGGGAGGGGGGRDDNNCDAAGGGGSGGSGGGGGGGAGAGGLGGGSSYAIFIWNAGTGGTINNSTLNTGDFGAKGIGGIGGNGGNGGTASPLGNRSSDWQANRGGQGGAGSNGGKGGNGADGTDGERIVIAVKGTGVSPTFNNISPAIVINSSVSGGSITNSPIVSLQNIPNKICQNSVLNIETTAASWALPNNWEFVKYNNSTSPSEFTTGSTTADITTSNISGFYDLTANGVVFNSYLNVRSERELPVITVNPSPICDGETIDLSATSWGTETDYKWEIFDATDAPNKGLTTGLVYSSSDENPTGITLTAESTPKTYIIRYQVYEECCGWSVPVFEVVTVNPHPTPTVTVFPTENVCIGTNVTYTTQSGNGISDYDWSIPGTAGIDYTLVSGGTNTDDNVIIAWNNASANTVIDVSYEQNGCAAASPTSSTPITLPNTGNNLSGNESATCYINGTNPIHFYNQTAPYNYIGSINPQGREGTVTMTSYLNGGGVMDACDMPGNPNYQTAYMERSFTVNGTVSGSNDLSVYFPFTAAELDTLMPLSLTGTPGNPYDDVSSIDDLVMTQYSGGSVENGTPLDNCIDGSSSVIPLTDRGDLSTAFTLWPSITAKYGRVDIPSFSEFYFHGQNEGSPLPVTLTDFSVSCDKVTTLKWTTASEQNSDKFIIEKSRDGVAWTFVAEQSGAGNSNTIIHYSQTDNNPWSGVSYYRLRQVDFDGKEKIYGPISSSCGKEENSWSIHPIPVVDKATVTINSKNSGNGELVIVDNNGKVILAKDIKIEKGSTIYEVDASRYSKGVYMIYLKGVYGFKPLKFVKF